MAAEQALKEQRKQQAREEEERNRAERERRRRKAAEEQSKRDAEKREREANAQKARCVVVLHSWLSDTTGRVPWHVGTHAVMFFSTHTRCTCGRFSLYSVICAWETANIKNTRIQDHSNLVDPRVHTHAQYPHTQHPRREEQERLQAERALEKQRLKEQKAAEHTRRMEETKLRKQKEEVCGAPYMIAQS